MDALHSPSRDQAARGAVSSLIRQSSHGAAEDALSVYVNEAAFLL